MDLVGRLWIHVNLSRQMFFFFLERMLLMQQWCVFLCACVCECVYAPVVSSITLDPAEHLRPLSRTPLPPVCLRPLASVSVSLSLSLSLSNRHTHTHTYMHIYTLHLHFLSLTLCDRQRCWRWLLTFWTVKGLRWNVCVCVSKADRGTSQFFPQCISASYSVMTSDSGRLLVLLTPFCFCLTICQSSMIMIIGCEVNNLLISAKWELD